MSSAPTTAQGQSKEQALAANDRHVRRLRSLADPLFIGSDHGPRVAATPRVHFASRRSPVRSRLAPLHGLPANRSVLCDVVDREPERIYGGGGVAGASGRHAGGTTRFVSENTEGYGVAAERPGFVIAWD